MVRPRFLMYDDLIECNQRCIHCDNWTFQDDRSQYLSDEASRALIAEFAELAGEGARFVPCGGEIMLDMERYLDLCHRGRAVGLRVLSVSNGTRITTGAVAERVLLHGPHEISISFDDWRRSLHEQLRGGIKNSFEQAKRAVRLLVEARDRIGLDSRILVMGLIHNRNYAELEGFYDLALDELGADALKLNFTQPTFGRTKGHDDWFREHASGMSPDRFEDELLRVTERRGISVNPAWLAARRSYMRSLPRRKLLVRGWNGPIRTAPVCGAFERNVHVDRFGTLRLCWGRQFASRRYEKHGDVREFWEETNRDPYRGCRMACGVSHSAHAASFRLRND